MKDRIGNVIAKGDKVLVALPEPQVFGFIADISESVLIAVGQQPGRVLVSCVFALPFDEEYGHVVQLVKVHDPDKHDGEEKATIQ